MAISIGPCTARQNRVASGATLWLRVHRLPACLAMRRQMHVLCAGVHESAGCVHTGTLHTTQTHTDTSMRFSSEARHQHVAYQHALRI